MTETLSVRYIVSGRVQGVGFRMFVFKTARKIDLAGIVRNLPDKSVEVTVRGASNKLQALESSLWKGPWLARVDSVDKSDSIENSVLPYPFEIES